MAFWEYLLYFNKVALFIESFIKGGSNCSKYTYKKITITIGSFKNLFYNMHKILNDDK